MGIDDEPGIGRGIDVGSDKVNISGGVKGFGADAALATPNDQNSRAGRGLTKAVKKSLRIPLHDGIGAHDDAADLLTTEGADNGRTGRLAVDRGRVVFGRAAIEDALLEVNEFRLALHSGKSGRSVGAVTICAGWAVRGQAREGCSASWADEDVFQAGDGRAGSGHCGYLIIDSFDHGKPRQQNGFYHYQGRSVGNEGSRSQVLQ